MIKELSPIIVRKIWGGNKLETMKDLAPTFNTMLEPIGETLEIFEPHLPYLVKFIDTSDELSIQVHPGDEYALLHENSSGKTECWVILEAGDKSGIYLGLKAHVTKDILKNALENKQAINELLNFYPVKKGDFFYIPSGSIHAIGKDITLAEVQQNSDITYRVWDWNRQSGNGVGRELHIDKCLDVINFDQVFNTPSYYRMGHGILERKGLVELCDHPSFHLFSLNLNKGEVYQKKILNFTRPCSILNLDGKIKINQKELQSYRAVSVEKELQISIEALESGSFLMIF